MRVVNRTVPVLVLAAAGCGRPPAVAAPETPPTATSPTAAMPATALRTPPTAHAMPGMYPKPAPPAAIAGDVPPALRDIFVERNQLHQRQSGALLSIKAMWVRDQRFSPHIMIDWAIDYDGPRRPFTILNPQLGMGDNSGIAHYWCLKPDGTVAALSWGVAGGWMDGMQPRKKRDWFSVSVDGKPVIGRLHAGGGGQLNGPIGRDTGPGDPPLWVQLEYTSTDRGDGFDELWNPVTRITNQGPAWVLDAWTGKLWSPVVAVSIK